MTKHTPGPWHSRPVGFRGHMEIFTASDDLIAALHLRDDTAANARLIAAAPDLIASLRRVLRMLEINDARLANFGEVEEARSIISRAEGAPYWGE